MPCSFSLAVNGCFLEVTNDDTGLIVYSFALADLRYTTKGDDDVTINDCCTSWTVDIDCIPAFADVATFIAQLDTWRDTCPAPIQIGAGAGTDCDTPLYTEICTKDTQLFWCELIECCNVNEASLTNGNPGVFTEAVIGISGLDATGYDVFGASGQAEIDRLISDLTALGYNATITYSNPPTNSQLDITIEGLKQPTVSWLWRNPNPPNDTEQAFLSCVGTGVSKLVPTWYVWLLSDGNQRWVEVANWGNTSETFPGSIASGRICTAEEIAQMNGGAALSTMVEILSAPCNDPNTLNVNVCPEVTINVAPTHATSTGAGSTTAGIQSVTICNIGNADGVLAGSTLAKGQCIGFEAYRDPVTKEFKRLGAISYDATGTTFTISEMP